MEKKRKEKFIAMMLQKINNAYTKLTQNITMTHFAVLSVIVFEISIIPELFLTTVNRAAGDDHGYGTYTRAAWVATNSLIEVFKAAGRTIAEYYESWQGTWFSIFMFTLQPEVFHEKAYIIVTALTIVMWVFITSLLLYELLVKTIGLTKSSFVVINMLLLLMNMQFVPGKEASMFWYNGVVHYTLGYNMCLMVIYLLIRYVKTIKRRYLGGIAFLLALLGGSNYQSALFALIITIFFVVIGYWSTRKKAILALILPQLLLTIGLVISMKAPGNKVRGGSDFGFSISRITDTIAQSFGKTIYDIGINIARHPLIILCLGLLLAVVVYAISQTSNSRFQYSYPLLFFAVTFCICCALQTPELYAATDVSPGVDNTNYWTFLLMFLANSIYVRGWLKNRGLLKMREFSRGVLPVILVCLLFVIILHHNIKDTVAWISFDYIISGQAADYKDQMDERTRILLDADIQDVVLPAINKYQGPLMHMPATEDPASWFNVVIQNFYGKNSVIAIDRVLYNEKYSDGVIVK